MVEDTSAGPLKECRDHRPLGRPSQSGDRGKGLYSVVAFGYVEVMKPLARFQTRDECC
jgi:hypothetical protein